MKTGELKTGTSAENRVDRITERLTRIDFCLERDKGNKARAAELAEEKEILGHELKVVEWKAKKGS